MSMSKRLQVVMSEEEFEQFRMCADRQGLTLSEWARQALRSARGPTPASKLQALNRALGCGHPTGDMEDILAEIEAGRDLR